MVKAAKMVAASQADGRDMVRQRKLLLAGVGMLFRLLATSGDFAPD